MYILRFCCILIAFSCPTPLAPPCLPALQVGKKQQRRLGRCAPGAGRHATPLSRQNTKTQKNARKNANAVMPLLIVTSQRFSWIQVLKSQTCNQCLKNCHFLNDQKYQNCQNCLRFVSLSFNWGPTSGHWVADSLIETHSLTDWKRL